MKSLLARCRWIVIILPGQDEKAKDLEECLTSAIKGNNSRCSSGEHKTCPSSHSLRDRSSIIGSNRSSMLVWVLTLLGKIIIAPVHLRKQ
ncbi:hypothetical protein EmuJ_000874000 [Echinococcus multilocularis]|uniref:Uncharacterized protein n=1 Tax=Echinococcus multilocularis TaxID=6211 RepID=A0A068YFJ0_ECHMU|nr:hypothetical protein EmuJ_000874000 [Echinococcus multilocularis]